MRNSNARLGDVLPLCSDCTQRKHTACTFLFAQPHVFAQAQSMFGQKETPSQVRVFALAGAIGIEPTQWESEAQVLPLHQAPSRVLLYINAQRFAIDFVNRK